MHTIFLCHDDYYTRSMLIKERQRDSDFDLFSGWVD